VGDRRRRVGHPVAPEATTRADRVVGVLAALAIALGLVLGLRQAHPIVRDRGGGVVEVDPTDCGRVLAPRCDWRSESVVAAAITMAGVSLAAAEVARARSRRSQVRKVSGSIGPSASLGMVGALVTVALPTFVVGLGLVLLVYHLQLMERLGS